MDQKQIEGSEPVVVAATDDVVATLTWGMWEITAWIEARPYAGCIFYVMNIELVGTGPDNDRHGLAGKLSSSFAPSPADAMEFALNSIRYMRLHSLHEEPGEDDWKEHERVIDLKPLLDHAVEEWLRCAAREATL